MDFHGKLLAERYRLESLLAEGGMGQVWVARHLSLDVQVAVKIMLATALNNDALRARFAREAKACAQLKSPHVVQVFDYGVADEMPFLVMELLDGEDLTSILSKRKVLPVGEAAGFVMQAAKGLAVAHASGIVHRDVKPSNLFLSRMGLDRVLKVLDFGIAKTFDDGPKMTGTNVVLGSPYYMSPEQLMGSAVDARTDVWSLAVVAFLMVTGDLPFRGPSALDVGFKIRVGERRQPSEIRPELGPGVDAFFSRALARDPSQRFATVMELAEALQPLGAPAPARAFTKETARGTSKMPQTAVAQASEAVQAATFVGRPEPALVRKPAATLKVNGAAASVGPLPVSSHPAPVDVAALTSAHVERAPASLPFPRSSPSTSSAAAVSASAVSPDERGSQASQTLLDATIPSSPSRGSAIRNGVMIAVTLASLAALALSLTLWLNRAPQAKNVAATPTVIESAATASGPAVLPVANEAAATSSVAAPPSMASSSAALSAPEPSSTSSAPFAAPSQAKVAARPIAQRPTAPPPVYTPPPPPPPRPTSTARRPIGLGF